MIIKKIDSYTHVPKERLVFNPAFPTSMKVELTSRCNYNCSYCASKSSLRPKGDIKRKFLYQILHQAKKIGVKEIGMFLLGESFLVKDLAKYIKYAKEKVGIEYVFITTNGACCTPDKMTPVIQAGLDSIKFSVNAGSRDRYEKMHGVDAFDLVIKNIKWLAKYKKDTDAKIKTCVSSIFIDTYAEELDDFKKAISPYVDEFYYLPLYNQAGHVSKETAVIGNPGRLENLVPPIPCWLLFNAAKVTWDGKFTACCFDHDMKFEIGDLNEMSLLDAWNHPKIVKLRKQHLTKNLDASLCAKCLGIK